MSQLTFQQQLWGALAPALVSTKRNSHAGAFAGAGVVVDLRLCEGVIEATESEVCGFQGPTEIFNSLCEVETVAKGKEQARHYLLD